MFTLWHLLREFKKDPLLNRFLRRLVESRQQVASAASAKTAGKKKAKQRTTIKAQRTIALLYVRILLDFVFELTAAILHHPEAVSEHGDVNGAFCNKLHSKSFTEDIHATMYSAIKRKKFDRSLLPAYGSKT